MQELFGKLWMLAWQIAAFAIVAFILWIGLRSHSHMWQLVSGRYRGKPASTTIARKLETALIATRGLRTPNPFGKPYRRYTVMLDIHDEGLALSVVPPFNIMCPPLSLPFDEMELTPTDWALWHEPHAIRMRQLPETDIIIGRDTVRWIREHVGRDPFGLGV